MTYYPDETFLKVDGFDDCIVGLETKTMRLIYSWELIVESLVLQGMSAEEAMEYFDFNIESAYMGEKTPIYSCSFLHPE